MNNFNIFTKSRQELVESLEFSYFLFEVHQSLEIEYRETKNPFINGFLKVLNYCRSCQYNETKDYRQLLTDYPFWEHREYYRERMRNFVEYKLSITDFIEETLYPSLSNIDEGLELKKDYKRQINIELDPRSFGFSNIISGIVPFLEGFDLDPEETFFTEDELREIIKNSLIKVEKYFINEP